MNYYLLHAYIKMKEILYFLIKNPNRIPFQGADELSAVIYDGTKQFSDRLNSSKTLLH